ncbi:toll/interleukin-1 receptor domain-containing protein [Clostridium novyi]|uniref:toll/interleukin-1 receptor domain-containing protein n=1 Tax=Clostridium novyi TaxID=1542 RepID=UPI0004D755DB|nr:toll/interleukin-1 receptor domain-containing protein [Clostridium novyi]KEH84576.1 putative molecular chaperone Tir [Clostridium novyi A str. NCTC 538]
MAMGVNRALNKKLIQEYKLHENGPCIFLSHKSEDKDKVEKIAQYIMKKGIDVYFDKYDNALQEADKNNDDIGVTRCIQEGISSCTHMMCILSWATKGSWWVPYELGFGEKSGKGICSLKLKEIPSSEIPSYIRIKKFLKNKNDFEIYIDSLIRQWGINNTNILEQKWNMYASYNSVDLSDVLETY